MRDGVVRDLFENLMQGDVGFPRDRSQRFSGIQNQPRNVVRTLGAVLDRLVRAKALVAPRCQLRQRYGVSVAAGHVKEWPGPPLRN